MKTLITGRETMTSKERVQAFFRNEETDRVPIDMAWNPLIRQRVIEHLALESPYQLRDALGVDFMSVGGQYRGPALFEQIPDRQVNPIYGWRTRKIDHGSGAYWD